MSAPDIIIWGDHDGLGVYDRSHTHYDYCRPPENIRYSGRYHTRGKNGRILHKNLTLQQAIEITRNDSRVIQV